MNRTKIDHTVEDDDGCPDCVDQPREFDDDEIEAIVRETVQTYGWGLLGRDD